MGIVEIPNSNQQGHNFHLSTKAPQACLHLRSTFPPMLVEGNSSIFKGNTPSAKGNASKSKAID